MVMAVAVPFRQDLYKEGWKYQTGSPEGDIRQWLYGDKKDRPVFSSVDEQRELGEIAGMRPRRNGLWLPSEFWEAYPAMSHIRQAAHSRGRSADAVFGAVLARLSAMVPPELSVDVGQGPLSLTILTALCGGVGLGKTRAKNVAMDLLPDLIDYGWMKENFLAEEIFADDVPLGSGQGIAEAFYAMVVVGETSTGQPKRQRQRARKHVFLTTDEGKSLCDKLALTGSEVGETIRSAASGATIGQGNASAETRRIVPAGTYSIGMAVGFQPATIGPLLREGNIGTPQRFLFVKATDPDIPRTRAAKPEWPGELKVVWPSKIQIPDAVCNEVWNALTAVSTEEEEAMPLAEHMYQTRIRVTAFLAALDGRSQATAGDWEWSRVVWEVSCAVRDDMARYEADEEEQKETTIRAKIAGREIAKDYAKAELDRAVLIAGRHIQRRKCESGCRRKCVVNSIDSELRKKVDLDIVITRVVVDGYSEEADQNGIFRPGKRPATRPSKRPATRARR
jgi:hypothetical protein